MNPVNPAPLPSAERWARMEEIFHQTRNESQTVREETLQRLCGDDRELLAGVRALLAADEEANRPGAVREFRKTDLVGRRIGNYQLDSLLGTGGTGSVYLAHRCDGQFDRQVALKILGANLRSEFFTERFAVERQLLASLDHPHIAGLFDSGVSSEGDPYLVLEYVDGHPIDQYCDDRRLAVADRIRLFQQVCAAVEFAHSRRVLHRDLKPSNILTTGDGVVKLLDFGTAKLLESASSANPTVTRFGMMTPRYASPEQLRGDPLTPSSDVYSLGIVLYELLTGAWPYGDPQSVLSGLERAVRAVEPRPPRAVVDDAAAALRAASKTALIGTLRGDLWKVILKAIQAEPERRYASVDELSRDLARYLAGSPVLARPQTPAYRASKFVWRNRTAVAVTLAGAALAGGLYFGVGWSRPAPAARSVVVLPFKNLSADPANQYFSDGLTDEITDAISHLKPLRVIARASAYAFRDSTGDIREVGRKLNVTNVLEGSVQRDGNRVKIVARLERTSDGSQIWSNTYERQISDLFSVQSELAGSIAGNLKTSVDAPGPAKHVVRDPEAVDAYMRAMFETEQFSPQAFSNAEADLRRAIERDPQYAAAYVALGATLINGASNTVRDRAGHLKVLERALPYYRKALELDPDLVAPRVNLATFDLQENWNWASSEKEYQRALANGQNATANQAYGLMLVYQGRFAEADEHLRLAQEQNPYSASLMTNLISARTLEHRYGQARELAEALLARSPKLQSARMSIAWTYVQEGHPELALADYARISPAGAIGKMVTAQALAGAGRREEALNLISPMEEHYQSFLPAASFATVYGLLGDEENGMKWLERSADDRDFSLLYIKVSASFDRLRNSPRFQSLLKRMGL
jgi:serine/threonine protein kinase